MNWEMHRVDSCDSTQATARELARNGAPHGTVVVANEMTGGRGQHGRVWHAPVGGWYASIVLRDVSDARLLTLALGNAVAEAFEIAGADAQLKWVNDVIVDGRKAAGILVEGESTGESIDFLVAGIGINFNGTTDDWPDGLAQTATTLEVALGAETCIEDVEPTLLDIIERWLRRLADGRGDEIVDAFRQRDFLVGKRVRVDDLEGTAQGIADDGALRIDGVAVQAGSVTIVA